MAKAQFHKNQRVYVSPVGTWAAIEQIKPQWVKDVPEPIRILYDVGLGRDFTAEELASEERSESKPGNVRENWRVLRAKNKWQTPEECGHHPFPGTFPVVVTDAQDWGGWRTPGAEYDRDPNRVEFQARLMASSLRLMHMALRLREFVSASGGDVPGDIQDMAKEAKILLNYIQEEPPGQ